MKHRYHLPRPLDAASGLAAAIATLLAPACVAPPESPVELAQVEARYEANARTYRAEQARLSASTEFPVAFPFDGEGTLIVHRVELLGGPDRAYVRARFTYLNSTGRPVPIPTVHLLLHDGGGEVVETASRKLVRPLGTTFAHDNAYTGWIDADARRVYRSRTWTWSVDLDLPLPSRDTPALSSRG
ncbi:MAG: hypothetical protein VXW31_04925 [Planctomycetota bacterium]|nr:hypothetical protein [Planctomycetota bacterium]